MENTATGIVILAAGSSSRLGRPKQDLPYGETTLLLHSLESALATPAIAVALVLGAIMDFHADLPTDERLTIARNKHWQEGIASSIRCGLEQLTLLHPQLERVLLMPCDQPFIDADLLIKLVTLQLETGRPVAACSYAGTFGIPAVFDRSMFPGLMALEGDMGAKKIIRQQPELPLLEFPLGKIDIDTEADYRALKKNVRREHDS